MPANPFRKPIPSPSPTASPSPSPSPETADERKKRELLEALKKNQSEFPAETQKELFYTDRSDSDVVPSAVYRDTIPERPSDVVKAQAQAKGLREAAPSPSPSASPAAKLPAQDLSTMSDKELQNIVAGGEYGLAMKIEARKILDSRKK